MLGKFEGNSSWDGFPAYQFSSSPAAPLPPSEQFHSNVECPPSSPPLHSEKIARESVFNAFLFFRETASLLLAASSRLRGKRLIPLPSSLSTSVRHPSCFLRGWRRRGRKGEKKDGERGDARSSRWSSIRNLDRTRWIGQDGWHSLHAMVGRRFVGYRSRYEASHSREGR